MSPLGHGHRALGPLEIGLVSYWKFDEVNGTRNDSVGTNHLADTNGVGSIAGKVGNAATFLTASSQKLSIASNAMLQTGDIDFTFAGWMYFDDAAQFYGVFSKGRPASVSREYELLRNQTSRALSFRVRRLDDTTSVQVLTVATVPDVTWTFVEAYHDSANDQIGVRINNGTALTAAISGGVFAAGSRPFEFGSLDNAFFLNGRLDEWGFWKRLLTTSERAQLYNSGNGVTYPTFS